MSDQQVQVGVHVYVLPDFPTAQILVAQIKCGDREAAITCDSQDVFDVLCTGIEATLKVLGQPQMECYIASKQFIKLDPPTNSS